MSRPLPFIIILAAFLCLCAGFVFNTPYRTEGVLKFQRMPVTQPDGSVVMVPQTAKDIGAPDERQHANFVKRLMEGKGLPVLDPQDPDLYENYQAHQPPLYYFMAAGFSFAVGADPTDPNSGTRLRLLSALLGAATLAGIFALVKWADGRDEAAWAGMSLGLMPMFVGLNSAVSNDPLLYAALTWSCALCVRAMKQGGGWKEAALLALPVAASFATKTTSLALIPVLITALVLTWKSEKGQRLVLGAGLVLALIIASPVWLRNMSLYGDPFALKVFQASFGGSAQASTFIEAGGAFSYWTGMVLPWTLRSLIGVFGYMDIYLFENLGMAKFNQLYMALAFIVGVILVLGLVASKQKTEDEVEGPGPTEGALWPLVVLGVVVLLLFIQFNRTYFQGQGRYLYPALPLAALLWGRGLVLAMKGRTGGWIAGTVALAGLSLLFLSQLSDSFKSRIGSSGGEVTRRYTQPSDGATLGTLSLLLTQTGDEVPGGQRDKLRWNLPEAPRSGTRPWG